MKYFNLFRSICFGIVLFLVTILFGTLIAPLIAILYTIGVIFAGFYFAVEGFGSQQDYLDSIYEVSKWFSH